MSETKKSVTERKGSDMLLNLSNRIALKKKAVDTNPKRISLGFNCSSSSQELKENFINIETDGSLENEKEKEKEKHNNLSLLHVLKKKLKQNNYTRYLLTFLITNDKKINKQINDTINKLIKTKKYETIKGLCLFLNSYSVMYIETQNSEIIFSFLINLNQIDYLENIKILYFSEMNSPNVSECFYLHEYVQPDYKRDISEDPCYVDEVGIIHVYKK